MKQPIVGGYNNALNPSTTDPQYNYLMGGTTFFAIESYRCQYMPTGGTIGRLFVELSTDPTNANSSYTFTLMVDGAPTALVVVIAAGTTAGSDTTHTIDVVAGQTVSLRCVASATAPAAATARWTTQFVGTTAGESICLVTFNCNESVPVHGELQGCGCSDDEEPYAQAPMATSGTFKKLYVLLSEDPGTAPDAYTIALRVGGVSKNNTVTIVADNTSGNKTNVTDVVAAGDLVNFIISPVSSPSATPLCYIGIVFISNTDGESLIMGGSGSGYPDPEAPYNYINLCGTFTEEWSYSETDMYSLIQACTVKNLYVALRVAPGAGKSYTISINKDGGAASGLTVTISGATDKAGHDTVHTYDPADGDTADINCVPASTPAITLVHIGLVAYIAGAPPPPAAAKKPTWRLDPKPRTRMRFYPTLKLG